jgi:diphosphomevalonate decarboxylase
MTTATVHPNFALIKYWGKGNEKLNLPEMREAILARDITKVGELSEHSCLKMHGAMLSANLGIIYWNGGSLNVIEAVLKSRSGVVQLIASRPGPGAQLVEGEA